MALTAVIHFLHLSLDQQMLEIRETRPPTAFTVFSVFSPPTQRKR